MKYTYQVFSLFFIFFILASCKKDSASNTKEVITTKSKVHITTAEDKKIAKSVLTKMMLSPETKTFVSAMVTANFTDMLSKQEGPFTVFAPSNGAFEKLSDESMRLLLENKNKDLLSRLINNHIVEGELEYSTLKLEIQKSGGKYKFTTLSDSPLTASINEGDIVIEDKNGIKALLVKKDLIGSNGVIHIVDAVLNVN